MFQVVRHVCPIPYGQNDATPMEKPRCAHPLGGSVVRNHLHPVVIENGRVIEKAVSVFAEAQTWARLLAPPAVIRYPAEEELVGLPPVVGTSYIESPLPTRRRPDGIGK